MQKFTKKKKTKSRTTAPVLYFSTSAADESNQNFIRCCLCNYRRVALSWGMVCVFYLEMFVNHNCEQK